MILIHRKRAAHGIIVEPGSEHIKQQPIPDRGGIEGIIIILVLVENGLNVTRPLRPGVEADVYQSVFPQTQSLDQNIG